MKLRKKLKVDPLSAKVAADELGQAYEATSERLKTEGKLREETVKRIKELAKLLGRSKGDSTLVDGETFTVGFTTVAARKEVRWEAFFKAFPRYRKQLMTYQIDEGKVERALQSGELPRKLLLKFVRDKKSAEPSQRVVVIKRECSNEG